MPIEHIRLFVIKKLKEFGEPLRWSITKIGESDNPECLHKLTVEAVVIIE